MKRFRRFCVLLLAALLVTPVWPQASSGSISGTVRDESGAVIPNAAVVLTNTATNVTSRTSTNEVGLFLFPGVIPGVYRIVIEQPGMQKYEVQVTVQVQQGVALDPVLRLGQTATNIEVQDVTPVVRVDTPSLGHVLERQRIEQLPINGRSITTLLITVPGMENNRAYGMREGSQEMILDGSALTDRLWGGNPRRQPGLDAVQEFNVENNASSARFTRPTSIVLSTRSGTNELHGSLFETHRNNGLGKARRREDTYSKAPQLIRNEFGASAGGPLWIPRVYDGRNRTFWFTSYEALRSINPVTMGFRVPTQAMRDGDFSELKDAQGRLFGIYDPWTTNPDTWERRQFSYGGRANVIDPARISPLARQLFAITPLPTDPGVNPLVDNNWWGPTPNTTRQWTTTTRVDHRITDVDQIYVRYTQGGSYALRQFYGQPMLNDVAGTQRTLAPNKSLAINYVRTFSPTLFNEVLVSASREVAFNGTGEPGVKYSEQLGLPNPMGVAGWPGIYDTGLSNYYFETQNTTNTPFFNMIVEDNATKVVGKHEFQFGFHYRYDQLNYLPDQQHPQGNHNFANNATFLYDPNSPRTNPLAAPQTGHNLANMFLGIMNYSNQFVRGYFYARAREYALYFQDNYRATSRLTLNLGLRWEYWPAYREKNNMMTSFDPATKSVVLGMPLEDMYRLGATVPSIVQRLQGFGAKFVTAEEAGMPENLMSSTYKDFGPRVGFAYRALDGKRAFVLRGGYRISYFPVPLSTWGQRMRQNPPLTARFRNEVTEAATSPDGIAHIAMRSVPTIIAGQNSQNAVQLTNPMSITRGSGLISYFAGEQPDSRTQDWNLTLEKEVLENTLVRVGYIGNHVGNLEQYYRYNENPSDYVWYTRTGQRLPTGEFAPVARRGFDQQVYGTIEEYRKTGWSNFNGLQLEFERRYNKGFGYQFFYTMGNAFTAGGRGYGAGVIPSTDLFLPGAVPTDQDELNRFMNYQRDWTIPKHRARWNWIVDLPFGKGKWLGRNAGGALDKVIGGWQVTGVGTIYSSYFQLPNTAGSIYPNSNDIELYGYRYKVEDCRSGRCVPGYLWWNGYIPAHQINSYDAQGRPNGVMGVPDSYRPAGEPLNPWPRNPGPADPMYQFYGSNTVWVPLNDGTSQRTTFDNGLHPWRNQFLPGPRQWSLDATLVKNVPVRERINLRFQADFFNVLNHPNNSASLYGSGNPIGQDGILSTRTSGIAARELQLSVRLSW